MLSQVNRNKNNANTSSNKLFYDRVGGGQMPAVLSQNRAYGSVHGSSWHLDPLLDIKPMWLWDFGADKQPLA